MVTSRLKGGRPNNSKSLQIMHKALENIRYNNVGGVVNYHYTREKYNIKTGETSIEESVTKTSLNPEVFIGDNRGKKYNRTSQEVLSILQNICEDLGADYFTI